MSLRRLRVGARSSRLSRAQSSIVVNLIKDAFRELTVELLPVKTLGDRLPPGKRDSVAGKGAFTGDLEDLLLKGEIDVAVHSMKDLPSGMTAGLAIGATPPRGDPRDALLSNHGEAIGTLPRGARVGTGSLRRKAQLLKLRGDLRVVDLHGNVETRIRRMASEMDAVVLAVAGLERIGESAKISQVFSTSEMVPAIGQGIIAVQTRKDDHEVARIVSKIDDRVTRIESECERAFAERLGGDCNVPVGGHAKASGETIRMVGIIASEDGREVVKKSLDGGVSEAASLGGRLADELLELGGSRMLERVAS